MGTGRPQTWEFKPRFRRRAFGWRSQPAIQRVKEAVAEIKKVARTNAALAAEGAVGFIERLFEAHAEDQIPYIESLADHWGELCASKDVASEWARPANCERTSAG